MNLERSAETLVGVTVALVLALVVSPVIRGITSDLNNSIGRAWPFSLTHCHAHASPGCDVADRASVGSARLHTSR